MRRDGRMPLVRTARRLAAVRINSRLEIQRSIERRLGTGGMTRNRPLVVGVAVVAATLVVGLGSLLGRPSPGQQPDLTLPRPGLSVSTPDTPTGLTLVATTHVGGAFDTALTNEPTAGPAQSKLWFAESAWWATLIDPATQELHIGRMDPTTQRWVDTGTLIDERRHVRADALWDGTKLTIVTAGSKPTASQAVRISQFDYDRAAGQFVIEPDLPLTLTAAGVDTPVLARESTGVLWLAYVDQTGLTLRHTMGDVWHWSAAAQPAFAGADGQVRAAAMTADGSQVTVVWNRVADDTLRVGVHADGADPGTWTTAETTVAGLRDAPGGLSIRTDGHKRLFVALETVPDRSSNASSLAPGAIVMIRDADGTWSSAQLGRVKDHLTRPVLALDEGHGILVAVAFAGGSGTITYKQSRLDRVSFESGRGADLVVSSTDTGLRNPTSTKQPIDLTTGLVVLGADDQTGHYAHGWLATTEPGASASPSPSPAPSSAGPSPSASSPPPAPAVGGTILLHDTFDPWTIGTRSPRDWVASPRFGGAGLVQVVAGPSPTRHALLVRTTSLAGYMRVCSSFASTAQGTVAVTELFELTGVAKSDTVIGSIRGPHGEAAAVDVTRHQLLAYYDRATKVTTSIALRPGFWYRSTIVLRLASHTYDWTVANAAGRVIARVTGIHWREAATTALDTICVQAPKGRGGSIALDDVEVLR